MSEITQLVIALVVSFLLDRFLKPYLLRKWLGVALMAALWQVRPVCWGLIWGCCRFLPW
ncbi:hypothetical protein [Pseudomonas sp. R4-84]